MDDETLIETLLYRGEGAALDYKLQQYPHDGATPEQKGELLKDILAFVNAWRSEPAYILIGVSNTLEVVGLDKDLDDSRLQQFINGKTNIPVHFSYRSVRHKGLTLGYTPFQSKIGRYTLNSSSEKYWLIRSMSAEVQQPTLPTRLKSQRWERRKPRSLAHMRQYSN